MNEAYHEQENIILKASRKWDRKQLHLFLRKRGFKSEDDFYELFRKGRCEPWQSLAITSISVVLDGSSIYETEEDIAEDLGTMWDELRCEYLLATLPRDCIIPLINEIEAVSAEFELQINYEGKKMDSMDLSECLNQIADQLSAQWDAPGSELLYFLIKQQYPQR